jgi:glycosyltransferase involved in cell wall biosynthesis
MKVSVVIPVHNGEKYLAQAIESVLAQTHRDLELIVVDDGSTDRTADIIERFARRDRRIRPFSQENRGVAEAANLGLREARGEWVARLDADDLFVPRKLGIQLSFLDCNPDVRIVGSLGYSINHAGRMLGLVGAEGPSCRLEFENMTARGEPVSLVHSSTVMCRETVLGIGGYRQPFAPSEDVDLWVRMAEKGYLLLRLPEPLVFYRLHRESLTIMHNAEQRLRFRWLLSCAKARRNGLREPSLERFLSEEQARPWRYKVRAAVREKGERYYQLAALHYAYGHYAGLFWNLFLSVALHRRYAAHRIYARKVHPLLGKSRDLPTLAHRGLRVGEEVSRCVLGR